jgi:hypothetical protein
MPEKSVGRANILNPYQAPSYPFERTVAELLIVARQSFAKQAIEDPNRFWLAMERESQAVDFFGAPWARYSFDFSMIQSRSPLESVKWMWYVQRHGLSYIQSSSSVFRMGGWR